MELERILEKTENWSVEEVDALTRFFFGPSWTTADWGRVRQALTSVDAALALVERVLPGWMWYVGSVGENDMPQAMITEPVEDCRDFVGHATTAPLAILLAMLKALQESQDAQ